MGKKSKDKSETIGTNFAGALRLSRDHFSDEALEQAGRLALALGEGVALLSVVGRDGWHPELEDAARYAELRRCSLLLVEEGGPTDRWLPVRRKAGSKD